VPIFSARAEGGAGGLASNGRGNAVFGAMWERLFCHPIVILMKYYSGKVQNIGTRENRG
jgi:hypothetical protein